MTAGERSELLRLVSERVERELLAPVRLTMGEGTPAERTALEVLRIVGQTERELAERWVGLPEAADRSGYSYDSVQRHAKEVLDGSEPAGVWARLEARRRDDGQVEVRAGTLPLKPGRAA